MNRHDAKVAKELMDLSLNRRTRNGGAGIFGVFKSFPKELAPILAFMAPWRLIVSDRG